MKRDYKKINKKWWNDATQIHFDSNFYDVDSFIKGGSSLNSIELELLGNIKGKKVLHLQCHFGQDSISLSRLGAKVTGVDLSDKSIEKARELAKKTNTDIDFVCCDIYDLSTHLDGEYDLIFASYGVISWLYDLQIWAEEISKFLKPFGKFILVEFHPMVMMFDDSFKEINYSYFNSGVIVEKVKGTYADRKADIKMENITWNHSISEVINSLIKNKFNIELINEYDYSPYDCFTNMYEFEVGKYRIKGFDNKIPMVYAIKAKLK